MMNNDDFATLTALWERYGTAHVLDSLSTCVRDKEYRMPDADWQRECRDTWALLQATAKAFALPHPIRETGLFQRVSGLQA